MRFVAISDTHGKHRTIRLPKGDVLLHAGDISYGRKKEEVADFLGWFAKQDFAYRIFIAGNHDFFLEKASPDEIKTLVPEGVIYLNDSGFQVGNI
ncbi:MAG TPA: metallophosphoesterase, partial [Flavisolibacter sp.]|nr:metallophosphoesterase [Flavisolibacter sp.]